MAQKLQQLKIPKILTICKNRVLAFGECIIINNIIRKPFGAAAAGR